MMNEAENQTGQSKRARIIIVVLLAVIVVLLLLLARSCQMQQQTLQQPAVEELQGEYVKPETPVDRSKNVTLPGWGGFTIPANTKDINQGFEFHNPAENFWYEDAVSINDVELEKLVVDSGAATELDHYLELAGIRESVISVSGYDNQCFEIAQNDQGKYLMKGISGFEGEKAIEVQTDKGNAVQIKMSCNPECYYMTFALYLSDSDELLHQSGLVAPGNYVQEMQMQRSLKPGTYSAYVVCQPYKSDKQTQTNQGVVKITLTAK